MRAGVATAEVGVLHDHDGPSILLRPLRAGSRKALGHDRRRVSFRVITSGVSLTLCLADGPLRVEISPEFPRFPIYRDTDRACVTRRVTVAEHAAVVVYLIAGRDDT